MLTCKRAGRSVSSVELFGGSYRGCYFDNPKALLLIPRRDRSFQAFLILLEMPRLQPPPGRSSRLSRGRERERPSARPKRGQGERAGEEGGREGVGKKPFLRWF